MPVSISHIAWIVSHPGRTADLLAGVFENVRIVREAPDAEGHVETRVRIGNTWLVLVEGQGPASRNGDHVAFAVSKEEQLACARRLDELAVDYMMAREDSALYFSDYDNHVIELDTLPPVD